MEIARRSRANNNGTSNHGSAVLIPGGMPDEELFRLLPSDHGVLGREFLERQPAGEEA